MTARVLEVMVVSPDRVLLRQLSRFLGEYGYRTACYTDLSGALAALAARRSDFLVMDEAAAVEGLSALEEFKFHSGGPYVHVLLLSGSQATVDRLTAHGEGVDDVLRHPFSAAEVLARLRAGARYLEFERRRDGQRWDDPRTGLPTRAALGQRILEELQTSGTSPSRAALVLFDLDFFRTVNERFGVQGGDRVLTKVAETLVSEAGNESFVARIGDNRFAVLLPRSSVQAAAETAQWLRQCIAVSGQLDDNREIQLTASAGIAMAIDSDDSPEKLLERATRALEDARCSGRDCQVCHGEFDEERRLWNETMGAKKSFASSIARDVMTPMTCALRGSNSLHDALTHFTQTQLAVLPVLDAQGRYLGLLNKGTASEALRTQPATTRVEQLSVARPPALPETASFVEIIEQFLPNTINHLVVTRDDRPCGVIERETFLGLLQPVPADLFARDHDASEGTAGLIVADAVDSR